MSRKAELREAIARALWAHERDPIVDPLAYKDFAEIVNAGFFARADVVLGVVGPLLDRVDTLETALAALVAAASADSPDPLGDYLWDKEYDSTIEAARAVLGGSVVSSGEPT